MTPFLRTNAVRSIEVRLYLKNLEGASSEGFKFMILVFFDPIGCWQDIIDSIFIVLQFLIREGVALSLARHSFGI